MGGIDPVSMLDMGLLQPSQMKAEFYKYYWVKLYSLATNLFKWEYETDLPYPLRFIELILTNQGSIAFLPYKTRKTPTKESTLIGNIFAPYVAMSNSLDLFGQPTKVKMTPFMTTNGTTTWQTFLVANTLVLVDEEQKQNNDFAVIGYNTHLGEGLEWLPLICAKLAILETAKMDNINLLKQPLTIIADEFSDLSADETLEEFSSGARVLKMYSGAGQELLNSLQVHSTGAENYIDTYEKQIQIYLKEAYERFGISTNIVDKKERVLQTEQLTQNAVSNLVYSEKWEMRQKFIEDIKKVYPEAIITCTPVLSLQSGDEDANKADDNAETELENEETETNDN